MLVVTPLCEDLPMPAGLPIRSFKALTKRCLRCDLTFVQEFPHQHICHVCALKPGGAGPASGRMTGRSRTGKEP